METADTFDILLFQTNNTDGQKIRAYTKCDYGKFGELRNAENGLFRSRHYDSKVCFET